MPLIHSEKGKHNTDIAIWEIHENLAFFKERLELTEEDIAFLENIHERRAIEWAASRYLLKTMLDRPVPFECIADQHGKPFIPDDPRHLSISHSWGMAMIGLSDKTLGVDIQRESDKIERLRSKFVADDEYPPGVDHINVETLHLAWSAKEAMFKLFAKGELDFKKHLKLQLPPDVDRYGVINGTILKNEVEIRCEINYRFIRGYIWVYAIPA